MFLFPFRSKFYAKIHKHSFKNDLKKHKESINYGMVLTKNQASVEMVFLILYKLLIASFLSA